MIRDGVKVWDAPVKELSKPTFMAEIVFFVKKFENDWLRLFPAKSAPHASFWA